MDENIGLPAQNERITIRDGNKVSPEFLSPLIAPEQNHRAVRQRDVWSGRAPAPTTPSAMGPRQHSFCRAYKGNKRQGQGRPSSG